MLTHEHSTALHLQGLRQAAGPEQAGPRALRELETERPPPLIGFACQSLCGEMLHFQNSLQARDLPVCQWLWAGGS